MAYDTNGWNGNGNGPILFTNVRVLDATGEYPYTGEVLIQGNRIKQVSRGSSRVGSSPMQGGGATVIDGMGATLMPGHDRRALASVLEQRAGHRSDSDDGIGRAHARHHGDGEARARCRLYGRTGRGGGKAAARRRRQALYQ